jgi:hypothetical protein
MKYPFKQDSSGDKIVTVVVLLVLVAIVAIVVVWLA